MTRRMLSAFGLVLALAAPGLAEAGEVHLTIKDGRVTLVARDVTLREILLEWERVGGTRIVNRDRVPGARLSLDLVDVPEAEALATLLRPMAGYMASRRVGPEGGASGFSRVIVMPVEATQVGMTPATTAAASRLAPSAQGGTSGPAPARPGLQRRVLPDGRVVTVAEDAQQAGENDDADDSATPAPSPPGIVRPPFLGMRAQQGQGASDYQQRSGTGQVAVDPTPPEVQPGQAQPATSVAPGAPPTVAVPGMLPAQKLPPTPPKPPGD